MLVLFLALVVIFHPGFSVEAYEFTICKTCKHKKIQPAIDAAWPGATVLVGEGVYEENLSIDKSITLKGAGEAKTIVKSTKKGEPVLSIDSEESKIRVGGLSLKGARAKGEKKEEVNSASGIIVYGKDNRITVKNCSFEDNDGWGVYIKSSNKLFANKIRASTNKKGGLFVTDEAGVTVSNSYFVNNKGDGVFAQGGGVINLYSNRIAGNDRGFHFYHSPKITLKNSVIENNGSGILTYMDLFRGDIEGSGNVINDGVSPPLRWGMKVGYWPENFLSASLTLSTHSRIFPYEDLSLPEGFEFEYVKYDKLLGVETEKLLSEGPKVAFIWGKGKVDYVPDPEYNQVPERPYVLNGRGHLLGVAGEVPKKSHLFTIYFHDGYGWKPAFFLPAAAASQTHKEVVNVEVNDFIYSSSGKEIMIMFRPGSPTNPIKRFMLNWTGDRLKVFHRSNYDRYKSSERYELNTYVKQRPVTTCFESALHPAPASFCYKQSRFWDGTEYEVLREELSWWGFDLDADTSGNCRKALEKYEKSFNSGLISYRSDPLSLAKYLKGRTNAKYWQAFKENGLAIIYRIEGRKRERLFAYQPFYDDEGSEENFWVLTSEDLYDKGKKLKNN